MSSASIDWFIDFFLFSLRPITHPPTTTPPPPTTTQTFWGVLGLIYATKTQIGLTSPPPIWRHFEFQTFLAGHHLYMSPCLCVCVYPYECPKTCVFLCPPPLCVSVSPLCVSVSPPPSCEIYYLWPHYPWARPLQAKSLHGGVRWGWGAHLPQPFYDFYFVCRYWVRGFHEIGQSSYHIQLMELLILLICW